MTYAGLKARLVWDGSEEVRLPEEMGVPRANQMVGTTGERLTELAGRVCYDSMGVGRSSADYFDHILGVGHLSIAEHFNVTVAIAGNHNNLLREISPAIFNRPGVWVTPLDHGAFRITLNPRTAREWHSWSDKLAEQSPYFTAPAAHALGVILQDEMARLTPRIVKAPAPEEVAAAMAPGVNGLNIREVKVVGPENDAEKWVTLYLVGSRGFSHELVRHGDFTAISQRSTRYVDENEGPWVIHPLIQERMKEPWFFEKKCEKCGGTGEAGFQSPCEDCDGGTVRFGAAERMKALVNSAQELYSDLVGSLVPWIMPRIKQDEYTKTTARKQARGAARGFLGNALTTEVIFSMSVMQARHILRMRAADAADAEIRAVFAEALPLLKACHYGDRFQGFDLAPSSDGIGMSLAGGGAK